MNTFKFVGKIKKLEDKKDKKFIETLTFEKSGWILEKVKFRVATEDTGEFVDLTGGKYKDDSKNLIYTQFIKADATNKRDTENAKVEWNDRFDPAVIEKIPEYKKYTVDLASDKIREGLIKEGKTDEASALATKKYTFISQYDFTKKVKELLLSGDFGDDNYVVSGTIEYSYSTKNDGGVYYRNFVPTSIYKAMPDEPTGCFGKFDFYYVKDKLLDADTVTEDETPINGYVQFYDRTSRDYYFTETALTFKNDMPNKDGIIKALTLLGDADSEVLVIGINVKFFSGSPKTDIRDEDLTQEQKLLIELGAKAKEDIIADMGGTVYGDRIYRVYVEKLSRGYANGPQKTDVTIEKLNEKPDTQKSEKSKPAVKIDLFDDDEI